MAKKRSLSDSSSQAQSSFDKGFTSDVNDYHLPENAWTYARNAINTSKKGDLGKLSNEFANVHCSYAPYTIIGTIHLEKSRWILFSTNNFSSEIGEFNEDNCTYTQLVNNHCLNFNTASLIKGTARPTFDCSFDVYFADGRNPDRVLDINKIPWVQVCTDDNGASPGGCITCIDKLTTDGKRILDCAKLRLESYIQQPCYTIKRAHGPGSILNGSYHVHIAYTVNQQVVTDYFPMSNILSVFDHSGINNALEINLSELDQNFSEYRLVLVSTIAEKTVARNMGLYSTNQTHITLDYVDNTLPVVPLEDLPIITPVPDKSDAIFTNGKYLLRVAPTDKFDFNYQPLANQIEALWTCVEYDKDYYKNGGTNVGHMRDEVYSYFIRWIYNTGDKSKSYHIPGRAPNFYNVPNDSGGSAGVIMENDLCPATANDIETPEGYSPKVFEVYNTANVTSPAGLNVDTGDGGKLVAYGQMGYWESTEFYDDKHPEIWNASSHPWSTTSSSFHDLCGKPIRHHKFPENTITVGGTSNAISNHYTNGGDKIRVMGIKFENIKPPVNNNGKIIDNIVGFEILRGSRNGNKSVLYKGLINNMFKYTLPKVTNVGNEIGLYANYPFNDLRPDPYISKGKDGSGNPIPTHYDSFGGMQHYVQNDEYSKEHFTFHSPDVMFNKPFLVSDELRLYGQAWGVAQGSFTEVENHPKHKFITDFTFGASIIVGIGYAIGKMSGTRDLDYQAPRVIGTNEYVGAGMVEIFAIPVLSEIGYGGVADYSALLLDEGASSLLDAIDGNNFGWASANYDSKNGANLLNNELAALPGSQLDPGMMNISYKNVDRAPALFRMAACIPMFSNYLSEGADTFIKMVQAISSYRQHALQHQSLCNYDNMEPAIPSNRRRKIDLSKYLNPGLHDFNDGHGVAPNHVVNHVLRHETVMFNTLTDVENTMSVIQDVSRSERMSDLTDGLNKTFFRRASSHYVGFKTRLRDQYGKISSIRQIPTQSCHTNAYTIVNKKKVYTDKTDIVYGGDTYIGRYSEKNTMYYFQQWMNGQPNGFEFDYTKYSMLEFTAYWMNTNEFDLAEFIKSIADGVGSVFNGGGFFSSLKTPSDHHCFDRMPSNNGIFVVKNAYMYLFNSGIRNFFVESELNIDFRDYGEEVSEKHYPVVRDLKQIFHNNIIKADNYYKIDRSLASAFLPYSKISWGSVQDLNYNPLLSASCYVKRPRRLMYSLPQEKETIKDNWRVFLPYNYKDFTSNVSAIKPIDKTAALILFEHDSPGILPGVDTIQTGSGTHLQIGDGSLFARDIQRLSNAEASFEYASCQSRLSVINTPHGVFWMSPLQGKIFHYAGGLEEISLKNNKMWLNMYMPFKILDDFPGFTLLDNPVSGVGCQSIYDNEYGLVYFCKKDYTLKDEFKGPNPTLVITYKGDNKFDVGGMFTCDLGDPLYFNNASWTLSYDPKNEEFISYHDWHPDLAMSGKNSFITTRLNGLWRHNQTCQKYCNYYGVDYPFEVEFQLDGKFAVSTMRNIEYYLENFIYDKNCMDRFMKLDHNFDEAVIYNTEQISGILKLNLNPKNDVNKLLSYPNVTPNYIDILFSKEEQQYRFNQFWDITKDRGEFTGVEETLWKTEDNGYIRKINPQAVDYKKDDFQKKKFRHYNNRVILRKEKSNNVEMLISLAFADLLASRR